METKESSSIDNYRNIFLRRNNPFVIGYNPSIMVYMKLNHNIIFVPIAENAWRAVYYITNYGMKDDMFIYEIVILMVIIKERIDC